MPPSIARTAFDASCSTRSTRRAPSRARSLRARSDKRCVTSPRATAEPSSSSSPRRVGVLGGGFGGLYTALRLDSLEWAGETRPEITVVDRAEAFVFKPLLYELVNETLEPWEVAPTFEWVRLTQRIPELETLALGRLELGTEAEEEGDDGEPVAPSEREDGER